MKERYRKGLDPDFYFWLDSQGLEVDVVERVGRILGLELTSATDGSVFS
jgi:hypothetical protein